MCQKINVGNNQSLISLYSVKDDDEKYFFGVTLGYIFSRQRGNIAITSIHCWKFKKEKSKTKLQWKRQTENKNIISLKKWIKCQTILHTSNFLSSMKPFASANSWDNESNVFKINWFSSSFLLLSMISFPFWEARSSFSSTAGISDTSCCKYYK